MRHKLLLLILFFTIQSISFAQVNIGFQGGINSSKLNGDAEPNTAYKSKVGAIFSAFVDIPVSKSIAISIQPSYSQEGTKISHIKKDSYYPVDSLKVKLNYFSIPVLVKVSSNNKKFYAIGGIESALLLNNELTYNDGSSEPLDISVNSWNFSIQFGAGYKFAIGNTILFVEARYAQGLDNITEDPIVNDLIPRVKSSSYKLLTGIEIPLTSRKK